MSLINEALKRTRDASFQAGQPRLEPGPPYRIRDTEEGMFSNFRSGLWVTLLVLVMAGVAVSALSLRMTKPGRHLREAMSMDTADADLPKPKPKPAPAVERQAIPFTMPVVSPRPERKTTPTVEPTVPPPPETRAEPPPAPEPPKFSLQGITIAPEDREAMINGYSVREGDDVDGARVVAIESRRVKLQFGEREIVLRMP